jgi:hypothetical protein
MLRDVGAPKSLHTIESGPRAAAEQMYVHQHEAGLTVKPQRDSAKRILPLTFTLILGTPLLLEAILEDRGWRAWVGSIAFVSVLVSLVDEVRTALRRRKPTEPRQAE